MIAVIAAPGWLLDLEVRTRATPSAVVAAGEGPLYGDLRPECRAQADRRRTAALDRFRDDLETLRARSAEHGGWRSGDNWDGGTFGASCRVLRVVAAPWASADPGQAQEEAVALLLAHGPQDATWGERDLRAKWSSAAAAVSRDGVQPWKSNMFDQPIAVNADGSPIGATAGPPLPPPLPGSREGESEEDIPVPVRDDTEDPLDALSEDVRRRVEYLLVERAAKAFIAEQDGPVVRLRDRLRFGDDVLAIPEVAPLIEGLLPLGATTFLIGESGLGKSALALHMALAVASGKPLHGRRTVRRNVLFVNAEGTAGLPARIRAICTQFGLPLPGDGFAVLDGVNLSSAVQAAELAEVARQHEAGFVILDTVNATAGNLDENDSTAMGQYLARARALVADQGGTVLALHHSPRDDPGRGRGSTAIYNGTDVELLMKGKSDGWRLSVTKDKFGARRTIGDFETVPAHGGVVARMRRSETSIFNRPATIVDAVRDYVREHPETAKTVIVAALTDPHGKRPVEDALEGLIASGDVEARKVDGRNGRFCFLAGPAVQP